MSWSLRLSRSYHLGRIVPKLDPKLTEQIADRSLNPKNLVSRRNNGLVRLPALLELAAQACALKSSNTKFRAEAQDLINMIYKLDRPDDRTSLKIKKADIKTELELRDKIKGGASYDTNKFSLAEDEQKARYELSQLIQGNLQDRKRDWRYYEYDAYSSSLYMATRLAPNYACLKTVMNEIRDLVPEFEPRSVLDFGSGMGTTIWAVEETWPKCVSEFMNIDLSVEQHRLCEFLLRGGKEFGPPLPGIFQRQYLPASSKVKYDMVVSAFSLLELPNLELRTSTVESLWHKTNDTLVLVERGNRGGFSVIDEARNLILGLEGFNPVNKLHLSGSKQLVHRIQSPSAYVVAPCPHEFRCPRAMMPSKRKMDVCRFRVQFEPLEIGQRKRGYTSEEFSYVVIRKRRNPYHDSENFCRWPRIVEGRKHSARQITHKLCCPNGQLAETVITAKKYGKEMYTVAKACDWGDILPVKVCDTYKSKSSFNHEQTNFSDKSFEFKCSDNK